MTPLSSTTKTAVHRLWSCFDVPLFMIAAYVRPNPAHAHTYSSSELPDEGTPQLLDTTRYDCCSAALCLFLVASLCHASCSSRYSAREYGAHV